MNFFIQRENNVSFSWYLDFHIFHESRNFKICQVIININPYTFDYFFRVPVSIKINIGHILVKFMTNISNLFLPQLWRLETSSRPFYNFDKIAVQCDLLIFDWCCLSKRIKIHELIMISFFINFRLPITCPKLTMETLEQKVKYVQS